PELWANHTLDIYGPPGYAPISTRDSSGIIYIQSTTGQRPDGSLLGFTFADFFNVWGQRFDKYCVPDGRGGTYCSTEFPPVISDGALERCIDEARRLTLSSGKSWVILTGHASTC